MTTAHERARDYHNAGTESFRAGRFLEAAESYRLANEAEHSDAAVCDEALARWRARQCSQINFIRQHITGECVRVRRGTATYYIQLLRDFDTYCQGSQVTSTPAPATTSKSGSGTATPQVPYTQVPAPQAQEPSQFWNIFQGVSQNISSLLTPSAVTPAISNGIAQAYAQDSTAKDVPTKTYEQQQYQIPVTDQRYTPPPQTEVNYTPWIIGGISILALGGIAIVLISRKS